MMSKKILDQTRRDVLPLSREAIADYVSRLTDERCRFVLSHLLLDLKAEADNEAAETFDYDRFLLAGNRSRY